MEANCILSIQLLCQKKSSFLNDREKQSDTTITIYKQNNISSECLLNVKKDQA